MGDTGPYHEAESPTKELDVESLLKQLTHSEKVALTSGKDFWHTNPIPRLSIPSLRLSDGPNGVRGTRFFDGIPAACLPCGTAIGATFDEDLVRQLGRLLGDEAKAKGAHVLLGPTINVQRSPLGGRGFESYSEDPFLSGVIAANYCLGVKDRDIVPTLKHFVCNDQEHERMAVNSIVTERALREIYLSPFQTAIRIAQPGAVMTSYNKVNGIHASENKRLLEESSGKNGVGTAIKAGLDLEMPGATLFRGQALSHAVLSNKVQEHELDDRVRNVLNLINKTLGAGIPESAPELELNRPGDRTLMRKAAADSIVLLKNEGNILPLKKERPILVVGPNARIPAYCGGGSASLRPYAAITPLDGIASQSNSDVSFAQGVYAHKLLPEIGTRLRTDDGRVGFSLKVFNEPHTSTARTLLEERHLTDTNMWFFDYSNPKLNKTWYADVEGIFTPEVSGIYDFGLAVHGTGKLYIDEQLVVSNVENQKPGSAFLGSGTVEEQGSMYLEKGHQYKLLVQWGCAATSELKIGGLVDFGQGGVRIGGALKLSQEQAINDTLVLAQEAEQIVIFAGLTGEWESEGYDRPNMDLPPGTDELISRVLDVNPNTVVVIQSGTPVAMPWISKAKSVLHAWFGGNEAGNGIADVVYGNVNPSAKLPLTIPKRVNDNPAFLNFRSEAGRTLYGEDICVGYRWYDKVGIEPLFPFGHGLSYTNFKLGSLRVEDHGREKIYKVQVTNDGQRAGAEIVQAYISSPPVSETCSQIQRALKELKGFKKVRLEAQQTQEVAIPIDTTRVTSFWDESRQKWCSEKGKYKILVGQSSQGPFLEAEIEISETLWWTGL